jgi:hypothetical protein
MPDDAPKKKRKWLRRILLLFLIVLVGMVASLAWIFRAIPVKSIDDIIALSRGGLMIIHLDPNDPEFQKFLAKASDGEIRLDKAEGQLIGRIIKNSISSNVLILSQPSPGPLGATQRDFFEEREPFTMLLQFNRLAPYVYRILRGRAADNNDLDAEDHAIRFKPENDQPIRPALTSSAAVFSSSEGHLQETVDHVVESESDTPTLSDLELELLEKTKSSVAQIRGYWMNNADRFSLWMQAGEKYRWFDRGFHRVFTAEVIQTINSSLLAFFYEAELLGSDILEIRLSLHCSNNNVALLVEEVLKKQVVDLVLSELPESKLEITREDDQVIITFLVTKFASQF